MKRTILFVVLGLASACVPSQWKIHGGPAECLQMCRKWNLEFAGMVGIGNQEDPMGSGATACVCQVPRPPGSALNDGGGASSGAMAGPITAAQAAVAANAAANQTRIQQQSGYP